MELIVITKTCYSGFLFTFLEFWETLRGLSPGVWAFSLLVFTVTSSKIMHTRHKNQNRPIVKVHESHNARSRDIPSQYIPLLCRFVLLGKGKVSFLCYLWRDSGLSAILGLHVTSPKIKLRNYRFFWVSTFTRYYST